MSTGVLPAWIEIHYRNVLSACNAHRRQIPWTWLTDSCEQPRGCWEQNLDSVEENVVVFNCGTISPATQILFHLGCRKKAPLTRGVGLPHRWALWFVLQVRAPYFRDIICGKLALKPTVSEGILDSDVGKTGSLYAEEWNDLTPGMKINLNPLKHQM